MSLFELLLDPLQRPHAYLDPGSGSFILQIIVAGALGLGLALRAYWARISAAVRRLFGRRDDEDTPEPHAEE